MRHRGYVLGLIGLLWLCGPPTAALELPQTGIAYEIEVTLDPETRRLQGRETIRWRNPSSVTTVERVPIHLYLNAFAHEGSTWMRAKLGRMVDLQDLRELHDDPWGWNEPRSIRQAGVELDWSPFAPDDGNPFDRSLIEVSLTRPVPPGEVLELEIDFEARLPVPIARTGGFRDFFLVAQWYPKIAVFETAGVRGAPEDRWNAHQFHGRTEFYADYADYDVRIGIPRGWTIAATGSRGPLTAPPDQRHDWHRYQQRAVHDFAFATGSKMLDVASRYQPQGAAAQLEIHVFLPTLARHQAQRWRTIVERSLDTMVSRIGPYPYDSITVVLPPFHVTETWGMEYPTLFTGLAGDPLWDVRALAGLRLNEGTIAHEFAHQYFYGLIGTNEFEEAFLDEGFTEHWQNEIMIDAFGDEAGGGELFGRSLGITDTARVAMQGARKERPPVLVRPSYVIREFGIGVEFYARPAAILRTASSLFGRSALDAAFAEYYRRWVFRHPRFEDFIEAARDAAGEELAAFLLEAFSRPNLPDYAVTAFESDWWSPPAGRLVTAEGVVEADQAREGELTQAGLDPAVREEDGRVMVEVLTAGSTAGDRFGGIERRLVQAESGEPDDDWSPGENDALLSVVRVTGPGWNHLPVEVRFRFADGAVLLDRWDGRGPYREYRFLRRFPLVEVRVDPDGKLALDRDPLNNGRLRRPEKRLVQDWSNWLGGLYQLLAEGLSQWL